MQEYEAEGIDWTKVEFIDNQVGAACQFQAEFHMHASSKLPTIDLNNWRVSGWSAGNERRLDTLKTNTSCVC